MDVFLRSEGTLFRMDSRLNSQGQSNNVQKWRVLIWPRGHVCWAVTDWPRLLTPKNATGKKRELCLKKNGKTNVHLERNSI